MSTTEGQPGQNLGSDVLAPAPATLPEPALISEATPLPPANPASRTRRRRERGRFLGTVQSLAGTIVIALFVITFAVQAFQIPSESMENTLLVGDYLLVDKVHFGQGGIWGRVLPYSGIHRGDIIVFRYPVHPSQHFVKRVIAVPGDRVRLINKRVFVNGVAQKEGYAIYRSPMRDEYRDDFPRTDFLTANVEAGWWREMRDLVHGGELVVPPQKYFVMGDNRDESLDSRYWGFVPRENIIGRPFLIYWSVRNVDQDRGPSGESDPGDKLSDIAYAVTHLFHDTRWNRTFRLVK